MRRWLLPATSATLALGALVAFFASELLSQPGRERAGLLPTAVVSAPAKPAEARIEAIPATASLWTAPPGPSGRPVVVPPIAPAAARGHETRESLGATAVLAELGAAKNLPERLHVIDDVKQRLTPDGAALLFIELLDATLPGNQYESGTLRLYVLGRLGETPGQLADAALVARIDPVIPRPERLVACEMLAGRPGVGRAQLEVIARDDHDTVVQERARWALARGQ
jgi:hypothetical protein